MNYISEVTRRGSPYFFCRLGGPIASGLELPLEIDAARTHCGIAIPREIIVDMDDGGGYRRIVRIAANSAHLSRVLVRS